MTHDAYKAVVDGVLCKGSRAWHPELTNANGADIAKECFLVAGRQDAAAAVLQVAMDENPQSYIQRMSLNWEAKVYDESLELKAGDWLVFAWSEDGSEGMNNHPIFSKLGNVTTGYLIEASGDFPVVWLSHDPIVKSGVFSLAECLSKRYFNENKRGKIDRIFRLKGDAS